MSDKFSRDKLKDEYVQLSEEELANLCKRGPCPVKNRACPFGNSILHVAVGCDEIDSLFLGSSALVGGENEIEQDAN